MEIQKWGEKWKKGEKPKWEINEVGLEKNEITLQWK